MKLRWLFSCKEGLKAEIKRLCWLIIPYGLMMTYAQNKFGGGGWAQIWMNYPVNWSMMCLFARDHGFWVSFFWCFRKAILGRVWEVQVYDNIYPPWNKWMGRKTIVSFWGKRPIFRTFAVSFGGVYINGGLEKNIDSRQSHHSVIYFILVGLPTHKLGVHIKGSYQIAFNDLPVPDHVCRRLLSW